MTKIIYQNSDGGVSVVVPSDGTATEELAAKTVPADVEYQIIDNEMVLPTDRLFRNAWTWGGINNPIIEDLEKSKVIADAAVKEATLAMARKAAEEALKAEMFGEPAVLTQDEVKTACADCLNDINAAEDTYEVKLLMCAYCGLPEPELPRDEQLRIKAEETKVRIEPRLQEIAAAVKAD